jgi:hypothetical protein
MIVTATATLECRRIWQRGSYAGYVYAEGKPLYTGPIAERAWVKLTAL